MGIEALNITCQGIDSSGKFKDKHTGRGEDVSPELVIGGLSPKAQTLVVTLEDMSHPIEGFTHWIIWNISGVHTAFLIQQLIFVRSIPGILLSLQSYAKMQRKNSSESITSAIRIRLHGSTKMTAYTLILSQDMRWKLKVL